MSTGSTSQAGSVGATSLLLLLFIGLRLCGIITWSWWWVLAPLWGPPLILLLVALPLVLLWSAITCWPAKRRGPSGRSW